MAELISLAANIIAVVGAAELASRNIQRLSRFREAPEQILQLQNEVSDARVIITAVQETLRQRNETTVDELMIQHIQRLTEKAEGIFSQITTMTENSLIKYFEDAKLAKVSWRRWIQSHSKIDKLSTSLCDVRRDLAAALTILTAADIPSVRVSLRSIAMETTNFRERLATLVSDSETIQSSMNSLQKHRTGYDSQNTATASRLQSYERFFNSQPNLGVRTSVYRSCRSLCSCVCHRESTIMTPRWIENLVGTLFIGYSGVPLLSYFSTKCTETACYKNKSALVSVQYRFPPWFLRRMVILRNIYSPLYGNQISVRTPRLVSEFTEIFRAAQASNFEMARFLFSQRTASPFDVAPDGTTPLMNAMVSIKKPGSAQNALEFCKLLVREGADVEYRSVSGHALIDRFWTLYFSNPSSRNLHKLRDILGIEVDIDESLLRRRFSSLHKIVLNLAKADLEDQLLLSTADIEAKCSQGRTPLLWATFAGNVAAIKLLIKYGANVEAQDLFGYNVLHFAAYNGLVATLTALLEEIKSVKLYRIGITHDKSWTPEEVDMCIKKLLNTTSGSGSTPLSITANFGHTKQARIMLASGAKTEILGSLQQPIGCAIQFNCHAILELLLDHGARLDHVDRDYDNTLLHVAAHSDFHTISILYEHGICCLDTDSRNSQDHTPLQCFDIDRPFICSEDETARLSCRNMFIKLLESIRTKSAEEGHDCWKNRLERAVISHETSNSERTDTSDNEEFFETRLFPDADRGHVEELEEVNPGNEVIG